MTGRHPFSKLFNSLPKEAQERIRAAGYGAMKDGPLDLDERIDLTKPIYEQAEVLRKRDERARLIAVAKAATELLRKQNNSQY